MRKFNLFLSLGQLPKTTTTDCEVKETESDVKFECPCGECSVETYLQEGCPQSCIPHLGMTTLSKEDQENLSYILRKDTKKIMDINTGAEGVSNSLPDVVTTGQSQINPQIKVK